VGAGGPIELLAPARDPSCGRAAIDCGADAVYIGPASFGAREKAANDLSAIHSLVRYAHRYRARVYATLNTLLHDRELPAARQLIQQLWDIGIDAVIIQDLGLLELDLPPVPLFASTQLDNVSPRRVRFLEELGLSRVILARELSLDEIAEIRAVTTVPLEVFVHGALCVSYSGRCTMSWALGGRSANRGRCAQPCRLPWTLRDGEGTVLARQQHLLSLHDLDRAAHLGQLVDAGAGSLKIEGRLKDERYVRNVVGHYRRSLDAVLEARDLPRASSGRVQLGFVPDPSRSFNRGGIDHFLHGRRRGAINPHTPKSTGQPIGAIQRLEDRWIELEGPHDLQAGDGLCFVGTDGLFRGVAVTRVLGQRAQLADAAGLAVGIPLARNKDRSFERVLDQARCERRIGLRLSVGDELEVEDSDGVNVRLPLPTGAPPARDPQRAAEVARAQLGKLGDTEFALDSCTVGSVPFLPRATWNELRRSMVAALRRARIAAFPRVQAPARPDRAPAPDTTLDFRGNVINAHARELLGRCGVLEIEPGAELGTPTTGRPVMTSRFCLRYELARCPHHQGAAAPCEPWSLEDQRGRVLPLRFDCGRCEMQVLGP
jgi:collagenase-like PrtC family protease